jgi:transcriptional regulator with XRE-family HTH domain
MRVATSGPGGDIMAAAETFAARLKRLREAAGLTQPELAGRAGMNQFGVAKLEQGVREPTWATVQALARALGVDCTAFQDEEARPAKGKRKRGKGGAS